jgi:glyoxylase-like metal-dependent hydrolase (beta-lactamase superfamily II)
LSCKAGLPAGTARIPWDGPQIRIIEHQAHAPGHAALLMEERGVLVAGDMLSDVPGDPRLGSSAYGKDFLPGVHARQLQGLARESEHDAPPDSSS